MDPLSDVISFLRLRSYLVGGFEAGGNWSVGFDAHDAVKCYTVADGACWIAVDGADEPVFLQSGDCFMLPRGQPFQIASDLNLPPDDWRHYFLGAEEGALVKLNEGRGVTVLGGHFALAGPQAEVLLGVLPPIVHLRDGPESETLRWTFGLMRQELIALKPGAILVAQQLACMIFIQALRLYLSESKRIGWLFALSDQRIGAAIRAIHRDPAQRWTVETLAMEAGMSRSGFAAHFRKLVGEAPIEYLTKWRMLLAGRRLEHGEPIGPIAHALGYDSESAFRTAFKRVTGSSPRQYARSF
ncbi:AraC family transcriptional regulator [Pelagovum pacificum]|uniref:AraC family transcriptional regulator n=1 Tax=Pelagovum pacificum TaxID=2588711 RepID=A0A5C5GCE4_9RHOB|nr:AraC family transcriptional regulator [Pelagovum pacificum]QQA44712.1 AraC family transcriptional regulator [Pelagovum pacificum]TNY32180.1 AraC family transcriptional regulator [Pelagovum pacificum]